MNFLSRIKNLAQPYVTKFETIRNSSNEDSEPILTVPTILSTELLPNPLPILTKPDRRKQPRSQKQIESYKKNFSHRHTKPIPATPPPVVTTPKPSVYDKIFSS